MKINVLIKKLNEIAVERAATTLPKRLEIVQENTKGLKLNKKEIDKLCDFVLEPFSKEIKERFCDLVKEIIKGKKKIKAIYRELRYFKKEKKSIMPRLPIIIKKFLFAIEKDKVKIPDKEIKKMFLKCFPDALINALHKSRDGTYYLITGDIHAMWLRDSALQIHCYLPLAKYDAKLSKIFEGVIKRQAKCIIKDPYAYAFYEDYSIRRKKFELDSLLFFIWLLYEFWKETGRRDIFNVVVKDALDRILEVMKIEQKHNEQSNYNPLKYFSPNDKARKLISKVNPSKYTGMIWSGFRPSDDPCYYNYHIPSQIFALKVLEYASEIYFNIFKDKEKGAFALKLRNEIEKGIKKYGIVKHENYGKVFAYEVDGYGNYLLMDDANLPSLLSIPYFNSGYGKNKIYVSTRKFILSKENPYYIEGKYAKGIGSFHRKGIWSLSLIMQLMTARSRKEKNEVISYLKTSHAGTYLMHEAFNANNPKQYTRHWFSMGNSLFAEAIIKEFGLVRQFKKDFENITTIK